MAILSFHLPPLRSLAVPSVCILICFLAYSSQYLFYHLEPGPLSRKEAIWFNLAVAGTWWSYGKACGVDPGRLPKSLLGIRSGQNGEAVERPRSAEAPRGRWCTKCRAVKPPRAHHCKQCKRCIPKMDHHCPWTSNCVSHTTFPHFLRFVYYTCVSLAILAYHLSTRLYAVYEARNLPAYLGPSKSALAHLMVLTLTTTLLLFALTILLVTATQSLLTNTTMIESWEIERHEALVERARYLGGYLHGPGGRRVRITKQEFPYDIGIWKNLVQGMGSSNIFAWILPFSSGPTNDSGWGPWEENGFEDEDVQWPPPDPDKLPRFPSRAQGAKDAGIAFTHGESDEVQAFRKRQREDYKRWETQRGNDDPRAGLKLKNSADAAITTSGFEEGSSDNEVNYGEEVEEEGEEEEEEEEGLDGEIGWTNSDGDRLRDYGVDEEAEEMLLVDDEYDEDIPLGELLRRRRRAVVAALESD